MILVFDLDDTLYNEISYMQSGFKEVSQFLSNDLNLAPNIIYESLLKIEMENGRGHVFDLFLKQVGSSSRKQVTKCVSIYRHHLPQITLNTDAADCLKRFAHLPLYIVTDGNKIVQQKKIHALGLDGKVKKVYVTHRYGIKHSKPSPYCFLDIVKKEQAKPNELVYIADNPKKDFIGIKPFGFKTIRILQGMFKNINANESQQAHYDIKSLDELDYTLLNRLL